MLPFNDDTTWLSTVTCGLSHPFRLTSNRHSWWRIKGQSNTVTSKTMLITSSLKHVFYLWNKRAAWSHRIPIHRQAQHQWKYDARGETELTSIPLIGITGHSWECNWIKATWGWGWLTTCMSSEAMLAAWVQTPIPYSGGCVTLAGFRTSLCMFVHSNNGTNEQTTWSNWCEPVMKYKMFKTASGTHKKIG